MAGDVEDALARHAEAVATVRAFAERAGALRVVLLVDRGDGSAATMIDCGRRRRVRAGRAAGRWSVPAGTPVAAPPRAAARAAPAAADGARPSIPRPASWRRRSARSTNLARGVLGLATRFGGRSVATADFATRDPDLPITIAAREGEPLVLAAGDRRFVLPDVVS